MGVLSDSFKLILSFDPDLYEIIWLSLRVSAFALIISCVVGFPIAGILSSKNFYGKNGVNKFLKNIKKYLILLKLD